VSDSKLNQWPELNDIVNDGNRWLFSSPEIPNTSNHRYTDLPQEAYMAFLMDKNFEVIEEHSVTYESRSIIDSETGEEATEETPTSYDVTIRQPKDQVVIESAPPEFTPSGNIWYSSLAGYPIYGYNLLKLIYFLVKQLFSDKTSFQKKLTHIVVSARGGYDLKNYSKLFPDNNVEVIHMEAFNISQKINFNIVELKLAFSLFLENLQEANNILKLKLPLDLRNKIINKTLPQLAIYTYHCAFFSAIKEQIPNVKIIHSGATLLSCAAIRAELETVYLYHGLVDPVDRTTFPFSDHIYVYANEEKSYFENISPNSNVCLYPFKELSKLEKRVIIFLRIYDSLMSEKAILEILTFFIKKDYQIFLKRHPSSTGILADKIAKKINLEMIDPEKVASETILNLRSSFTVSWKSTALCESLLHGVVPISLSGYLNTYSHDRVDTAIYSIKKRSLSWVEEKERIFDLLEDNSLYKRTLSELRTR